MNPITHEVRHFHLFAGLGGGAKGFNRGEAFSLSAAPVWVRPVAVGLSVAQGGAA